MPPPREPGDNVHVSCIVQTRNRVEALRQWSRPGQRGDGRPQGRTLRQLCGHRSAICAPIASPFRRLLPPPKHLPDGIRLWAKERDFGNALSAEFALFSRSGFYAAELHTSLTRSPRQGGTAGSAGCAQSLPGRQNDPGAAGRNRSCRCPPARPRTRGREPR